MSYVISGSSLKAQRVAADLSQEEVARVMGVSVKTVQRTEHADSVKPRDAVSFQKAVEELSRQNGVPRSPDNVVPRGTSHSGSPGHAARLERAKAFEREMIRLGADDFEADHVRVRARSFIESVLSSGGTGELTEAELDREFELYLEHNLRIWVIEHMKRRGVQPDVLGKSTGRKSR